MVSITGNVYEGNIIQLTPAEAQFKSHSGSERYLQLGTRQAGKYLQEPQIWSDRELLVFVATSVALLFAHRLQGKQVFDKVQEIDVRPIWMGDHRPGVFVVELIEDITEMQTVQVEAPSNTKTRSTRQWSGITQPR